MAVSRKMRCRCAACGAGAGLDQERDLKSPEIEQWLREHLDPDDFAGLCEMIGVSEPAETLDEEIDRHTRGRDEQDAPMSQFV